MNLLIKPDGILGLVGDVFVFGFTGDDLDDVDVLSGEFIKTLVLVVG